MKPLKLLRSVLLLIIIAMLCIGCAPIDDNGETEGAKKEFYTVKYHSVENGIINGQTIQQVKHGGSTTEVTAVPNYGFTFGGWSDGVAEATRTDIDIKDDIVVYPIYNPIPYSITYVGMCDGKEIYSYVFENTTGTRTEFDATAVIPGYQFLNWSDEETKEKREDSFESDGKTITAYYAEIEYKTPIVNIQVENGQAITSKEVYLNCTVEIDSDISDHKMKNVVAEIRGRGNYTWTGCPKKSYRLKFDRKRSVLGSENKAKSWVLLSNGWDNSLVRNYTALELSERFSALKFTSTHEFIELYVNGNYLGLYLVCDLIQAGEGRVELNEDLSDPNDMAFLVKRDTYARKEGQALDVEYFELPNDYDWCFEIHYPDPEDPFYNAEVYVPYIQNYLYDALDAIGSKDWELIQEYIDVESFAEMYILQECILNLDVGWNSFYMYKDKGGKLCLGPAWDFDLSAGNYKAIKSDDDGNFNDAYPAYDIDNYDQLWCLKKNTWFRRMVRVPEFVDLLCKKLDELDSTIKDVYSLTDPTNEKGLYKKYDTEMNKNLDRWGIFNEGPSYIRSLKTIEEQHKYLYDWLTERLKVVRTYYGMPAEKEKTN